MDKLYIAGCFFLYSLMAIAEPQDFKGWLIDISENKMDNIKSITMARYSSNELIRYGRPFKPLLGIRCNGKDVDIIVSPNELLESRYSDVFIRVRYKIDSENPESTNANLASNRTAFFMRSPRDLINRLRSASNVIFEYVPYESSSKQAEFDMTNFNEALEKIAPYCNL